MESSWRYSGGGSGSGSGGSSVNDEGRVLVISRSSLPAPFNSSADGGGASGFVTGTTRPLFPIGAPSLMPVLLGRKEERKEEDQETERAVGRVRRREKEGRRN